MTPHRRFKEAIYEQFARLGKVIAAPKRIELLDLLSQGPCTVEVLAAQASISVANASQHLQIMRAARLITAEKKGLYVEYRLASDDVGKFYYVLRALAQAHLAEVAQLSRAYFEARETLEPVNEAELVRRVRHQEVVVLDVRPEPEYRAGHLPGAISIPVNELAARLGELPRGREIVAYCRGPYCVMALDAVALLKKQGYRAQRLESGVLDWRARGWRVDKVRSARRPRASERHA